MVVENCEVIFTDGQEVQYHRVTFKDNGWLGANYDGAWEYYPPHMINQVNSLDYDVL